MIILYLTSALLLAIALYKYGDSLQAAITAIWERYSDKSNPVPVYLFFVLVACTSMLFAGLSYGWWI